MAITLVGTPVVNSAASGAVTFTKTLASGSSLVLCLNVYDSSGTSPMTVSVTGGGGTWASVVLATANAFTSRSQIWCCFNPTSGSQTITVTPTTAGDTVVGVLSEFTGLLAGSVTLGTTSAFTSTPSIGPSAATTNAVELVVATLAAFTTNNGGTSPATTGYTNLGNQVTPNGTIRADYKVTSSTGTQSAAWGTLTAGDTQNATLATFIDNSGPSGNSDGWPLAGMVAVGRLLAGGGGNTAALTGQSTTSAVGTLTPTITTALTGQATTSAVGTLTPSQGATAALTGVSATSAVGTLTPSIATTFAGVSATSAVGAFAPNISVALVGQSATSAVGTLTATLASLLTGQAGTSAVGTLTPSITVAFSGVGSTASVGTLSPNQGATASLTGVSATSDVGVLTPIITTGIVGVGSTSAVGTLTANQGNTGNLTGQFGTSDVGIFVPSISAAFSGVSATASAGTLTPFVATTISGQQATSAVGVLTAALAAALAGVQSQSDVGTLTPSAGNATVALVGVEATSAVGVLTAVVDTPVTQGAGQRRKQRFIIGTREYFGTFEDAAELLLERAKRAHDKQAKESIKKPVKTAGKPVTVKPSVDEVQKLIESDQAKVSAWITAQQDFIDSVTRRIEELEQQQKLADDEDESEIEWLVLMAL